MQRMNCRLAFTSGLTRGCHAGTRAGVLTALIGADKAQDSQSVRTHDYLHAVARKGRLDFIPLFESRLHREALNSEV